MKRISIADITLKEAAKCNDITLSFREKIEIAKLLAKINVSTIELPAIKKERTDVLLIKTIASVVKNSVIAVPVDLFEQDVERVADAIKCAEKPRIQIQVPSSTVQMEYICNKKPPKVLEMIADLTSRAKALCDDVEFIADDATRSEKDFLAKAISTAIENGATSVSLCDDAGQMLPDEFESFIAELYEAVPSLKDIELNVACNNSLGLAGACVISAIKAGAAGVKSSLLPSTATATTDGITRTVSVLGLELGFESSVAVTELSRTVGQIEKLISARKMKNAPLDTALASDGDNSFVLNDHDSLEEVMKAVKLLGYDISTEDMTNVYEEFKRISKRKNVGSKELDAIVASVAMQVPRTYTLDSYIINSGNLITATANISLIKDDEKRCGLSSGDGPINAAFLAIEQIIGKHYELDDFQIQAVTEGQEAMGSALVKLRSNGRLYSGTGLSTDIIGASIRAYVNALNKIVYEEA